MMPVGARISYHAEMPEFLAREIIELLHPCDRALHANLFRIVALISPTTWACSKRRNRRKALKPGLIFRECRTVSLRVNCRRAGHSGLSFIQISLGISDE
jgi:hypothetical protein